MNDELLWQNLKDGDKSALEKIYRNNAPILIQYGKKFTRNTTEIEDSIHDLMVNIWKNRSGLSPTDSIKNYLMVAFRRTLIRKLQKKDKTTSDHEVQDYQFGIEAAADEKVIQNEEANEQKLKMQKAMETLSARQKEAIYLKYTKDLDYEQICEIMDLNYQSARNLIAGAIKKMKTAVLFIVLLINFFQNN